MKRFLVLVSLLIAASVGRAAALPVTPFTVVAKVVSFEHQRAPGIQPGYSQAAPHGNEGIIVATIILPESLAGREITIPFQASPEEKELLIQKGTTFRFEHNANLGDIHNRTDWVFRRGLEFPGRGILVLKPGGEVAEAYEGVLTRVK